MEICGRNCEFEDNGSSNVGLVFGFGSLGICRHIALLPQHSAELHTLLQSLKSIGNIEFWSIVSFVNPQSLAQAILFFHLVPFRHLSFSHEFPIANVNDRFALLQCKTNIKEVFKEL